MSQFIKCDVPTTWVASQPDVCPGTPQGFAVACWFIPLTFLQEDKLIAQNSVGGAGTDGWRMYFNLDADLNMSVAAEIMTAGGELAFSGDIAASNNQELLVVLNVPPGGGGNAQLWVNGTLVASAVMADDFVPAAGQPLQIGEASWPNLYIGGLGYFGGGSLGSAEIVANAFTVQQTGHMLRAAQFGNADAIEWDNAWDGASAAAGVPYEYQGVKPAINSWLPRSGDEILTKQGPGELYLLTASFPGNWAQGEGGGGGGGGGGTLQAAYDAGSDIDVSATSGSIEINMDGVDPLAFPMMSMDATGAAAPLGPMLQMYQQTSPGTFDAPAIEINVVDPLNDIGVVKGADAGGGNNPGTNLATVAGAGSGTGGGGSLILSAGNAGGGVGSVAGVVLITGGAGGTNGEGGGIALNAGSSLADFPGGVDITGGAGTAQQGGRILLQGGLGNGITGGEVSINGGTANGVGTGGDVDIHGGGADGTGNGGYVRISAGTSVGGTRGGFLIQQGTGTIDFSYEGSTRHFGATDVNGTLRVASVTTTQRDAMTLQQGLLVYNTTTAQFEGYNGATWENLTGP